MLSSNAIHIVQSGVQLMRMFRGLAEGGYLGTLLYPLLPDGLAKQLAQQNQGPAMIPAFTTDNPVMTADVMKAADAAGVWRIPLLLHADDQVIPGSSLTALQGSLDMADQWSVMAEQQYHVDKTKTVAMCLVMGSVGAVYREQPLHLSNKSLTRVDEHRYLGHVWQEGVKFEKQLMSKLQATRHAAQPVIAQARKQDMPLHLLAEMAEAKCKGTLFAGFVLLPLID